MSELEKFVKFLAELNGRIENLEEEVKTLKENNSASKMFETLHRQLKDTLDVQRVINKD